jgi:hypothetical protein
MEIDNGNEAEEICIRQWESEPDSELKRITLQGLYLQCKINNLVKNEITVDVLLELLIVLGHEKVVNKFKNNQENEFRS